MPGRPLVMEAQWKEEVIMMADAPDVGGVGYQNADTDAPANDLSGPDFTPMCEAAMQHGMAAGQKRASGDAEIITPDLPPVPWSRP